MVSFWRHSELLTFCVVCAFHEWQKCFCHPGLSDAVESCAFISLAYRCNSHFSSLLPCRDRPGFAIIATSIRGFQHEDFSAPRERCFSYQKVTNCCLIFQRTDFWMRSCLCQFRCIPIFFKRVEDDVSRFLCLIRELMSFKCMYKNVCISSGCRHYYTLLGDSSSAQISY